MATSSSSTETCDTGLCPICHEKYCIPRSLSTCGHVFCEKCLFDFVFNLKKNGELGSNFLCPVCQEAHPVQDSQQLTLEWIKTFPLCEKYIAVNVESTKLALEDASPVNLCGPCEGTGVTVPGEKYCKGCRAYLCGDCLTSHSKFESLISHKIIDETDPAVCEKVSAAVNQYAKCPKHPGRDTELFCKDKEELLCFKCTSTIHKDCTHDIEITECSDLSKVKVESIRTRILKSLEHLKNLQNLSNENQKVVNNQLETLVKEVETVRKNVIRSLDDIYENALARKKQLKIDMEDQQFAMTQSSEKVHREYEKKNIIMESILKHGSQVEIFATLENMEKEIDILEKEVFQLDTDFTIGDVDFAFINELKATAEQLDSSKTCSIAVTYKTGIHQPRFIGPVETCSYQVEKHVDHKIEYDPRISPTFTHISFKHDGTIVLCDNYNGLLYLYNTDNEEKQTLKIKKPFCATLLDIKRIALTIPNDKTIAVISTGTEMKEEKSLKTKYVPKSIIALQNGTVAISWANPPGFSISDISGDTEVDKLYFTQDSDMREFKYFDYMAIDERREHVIQPCIKDKVVYCFDFAAKPVFKYTNNIEKPQGVTVDLLKGSVFVCDADSNSIHHLTCTGSPLTIIQHAALQEPLAIFCDMHRNCIWVTNSDEYDVVTCYERK